MLYAASPYKEYIFEAFNIYFTKLYYLNKETFYFFIVFLIKIYSNT